MSHNICLVIYISVCNSKEKLYYFLYFNSLYILTTMSNSPNLLVISENLCSVLVVNPRDSKISEKSAKSPELTPSQNLVRITSICDHFL